MVVAVTTQAVRTMRQATVACAANVSGTAMAGASAEYRSATELTFLNLRSALASPGRHLPLQDDGRILFGFLQPNFRQISRALIGQGPDRFILRSASSRAHLGDL